MIENGSLNLDLVTGKGDEELNTGSIIQNYVHVNPFFDSKAGPGSTKIGIFSLSSLCHIL